MPCVRTLDPDDYRLFLIQLTPAGRELIRSAAPKRIRCMVQMVSGLNEDERSQLIALLSKLYRSLLAESNMPEFPFQGG